jgi:alpha,alpha-trehalase
MKRIIEYRRRTQFDPKWGLWFWDNAMQSGADNNPALTNDEKDRSAILAVDASIWAMREYQAMAVLAQHMDDPVSARVYQADALAIRKAIRLQLYSPRDAMFWNRRRDTGEIVHVIAWSNFLPLIDGLISRGEGRRMIQLYLLNPAQMRSPHGFRSLSGFDRYYNNEAIINPYSNWRGPIWINANFLDWVALRRYCFNTEAHWLAVTLAEDIHRDIERWGSMHEDYNAESGDGLAPTPEQSPGGKFAGFVGWNLLAQDMLQCEATGQHCLTFSIDAAP